MLKAAVWLTEEEQQLMRGRPRKCARIDYTLQTLLGPLAMIDEEYDVHSLHANLITECNVTKCAPSADFENPSFPEIHVS